MKKENFVSDLREALDVALLKEKAMHQVAGDKNKNKSALFIIIVAAVLGALGMRLFGGFYLTNFWSAFATAIFQVVATIIGIYVLSVVAKSVFKGSAQHDAFFRVAAFGLIVTWLSLFPPLSLIGGLWGLVVIFVILKVVHKLTTGGALGTIVVSVIILALINMLLAPTFAAMGLGGAYGMGYGKMMDFGKYGDDFMMNFKGNDGESSMEMKNGKMTITGPDGEEINIEIPDYK
jgi:hypothetical protein